MSLIVRTQLRTPWDKNLGSSLNYWRKKGCEHMLEWAIGEMYNRISFQEARDIIYKNIGVVIVPFESMHLCDKIKIEWEKSGKIIPNKRMVLIEKRKPQ